jgi:hypothetical protein
LFWGPALGGFWGGGGGGGGGGGVGGVVVLLGWVVGVWCVLCGDVTVSEAMTDGPPRLVS